MMLTKKIGNKTLSWFARIISRFPMHHTQCGLRPFRAEPVDRMLLSQERIPFAIEMIADAHLARATTVETLVRYRMRVGRTKVRPLKGGLRIL